MAQERKSKTLGRTSRPRGYVRSSEHKRISNRELCRQWVEAYRPDRLDDLLALLHPDIEWITTETWVEREVWHGHAGVRAGLRRFFSEWEEFSNDEVEAFSDGGDKFAVVTRMRGRSRGTHIPTEMRTSGVAEVRDGLIVRVIGHSDPADALAAVAMPATTARAMSQENVEIVLRLYAEVNARLYGASPDLFVEEYEVDARDVAVDFGVVKGFDAVTQALQTYWETFDGFPLELEEVIHADGQQVVTAVRDGGRIKDSDDQVWERFFHVWAFRDGKVVRLSLHADRRRALEAAGLQE